MSNICTCFQVKLTLRIKSAYLPPFQVEGGVHAFSIIAREVVGIIKSTNRDSSTSK